MIKIFTIGDSLTAGLPGNDPRGKGNRESTYQYWLEQALNKSASYKDTIVYNFGFPGLTIGEISTQLFSLSKEQPFKESELVIINGGGNDWTNESKANLDYLLNTIIDCCAYCLKEGKTVICTSITPFGDDSIMEDLKLFVNRLAKFVKNDKSKKIMFFDWFQTVYDPKTNRLKDEFDSGDGEHLNINGYKAIGTGLAELLLKKSTPQ